MEKSKYSNSELNRQSHNSNNNNNGSSSGSTVNNNNFYRNPLPATTTSTTSNSYSRSTSNSNLPIALPETITSSSSNGPVNTLPASSYSTTASSLLVKQPAPPLIKRTSNIVSDDTIRVSVKSSAPLIDESPSREKPPSPSPPQSLPSSSSDNQKMNRKQTNSNINECNPKDIVVSSKHDDDSNNNGGNHSSTSGFNGQSYTTTTISSNHQSSNAHSANNNNTSTQPNNAQTRNIQREFLLDGLPRRPESFINTGEHIIQILPASSNSIYVGGYLGTSTSNMNGSSTSVDIMMPKSAVTSPGLMVKMGASSSSSMNNTLQGAKSDFFAINRTSSSTNAIIPLSISTGKGGSSSGGAGVLNRTPSQPTSPAKENVTPLGSSSNLSKKSASSLYASGNIPSYNESASMFSKHAKELSKKGVNTLPMLQKKISALVLNNQNGQSNNTNNNEGGNDSYGEARNSSEGGEEGGRRHPKSIARTPSILIQDTGNKNVGSSDSATVSNSSEGKKERSSFEYKSNGGLLDGDEAKEVMSSSDFDSRPGTEGRNHRELQYNGRQHSFAGDYTNNNVLSPRPQIENKLSASSMDEIARRSLATPENAMHLTKSKSGTQQAHHKSDTTIPGVGNNSSSTQSISASGATLGSSVLLGAFRDIPRAITQSLSSDINGANSITDIASAAFGAAANTLRSVFSGKISPSHTTDSPGKTMLPAKSDLSHDRRKSDTYFSANNDGVSSSSSNSSNVAVAPKNDLLQNVLRRRNFRKFNSCSTLFVEGTVTSLEVRDMLMCSAIGIYCNIKYSHEIKSFRSHDIFSEKLRPLTRDITPHKLRRIPEVTDILKFLAGIFDATKLNGETAIISMIYMERMMRNTGVTLYCSNWRRVVLGSILLASKVWDDQTIWNVDFNTCFPDVPIKDLNNLERWYLKALEYNVSVPGSTYAQYYFELRDLFNKAEKAFSQGKPISHELERKFMGGVRAPSMVFPVPPDPNHVPIYDNKPVDQSPILGNLNASANPTKVIEYQALSGGGSGNSSNANSVKSNNLNYILTSTGGSDSAAGKSGTNFKKVRSETILTGNNTGKYLPVSPNPG